MPRGRNATQVKEEVANEVAVNEDKTEVKKESKPIIPKDVDPNTIVLVKNGFQGKLVYISPRTHEKFVWDNFGDEQELELRELRNAKSSAKKFFQNNWFMFDEDDAWVIPYLGLQRYYQHAISLEDFDEVFRKSPAEITKLINSLSKGQKKSLSYRARQLVISGDIDSRKVIAALESALDTELIER